MSNELERELKPCPFCGGEAAIEQDCRNGFKIKCKSCLIGIKQKVIHQSLEWLRDKMIEGWNTRQSQPNEQGKIVSDEDIEAMAENQYHILPISDWLKTTTPGGFKYADYCKTMVLFRKVFIKGFKSALQLPQPKGSGMRWVKASDRMPRKQDVAWKRIGSQMRMLDCEMIQDFYPNGILYNDKVIEYKDIEWLDETPPHQQQGGEKVK